MTDLATSLAFGFHDLEQQANTRITQIGIQETSERIAMWQNEVNRVFNYIFNTFCTRNERWNTMPITRYQQPSAAYAQFVDDKGIAKPRIEQGYFEVGLPLMRYEDRVDYTFETLQSATVAEFNRELLRIERADRLTAIKLFLFACLYPTNWTFKSTEQNMPDIPVKAAANTDGVLYTQRGDSAPAEAQHYLAQSNAIDDSHDPFGTISELLTGYAGTTPDDRIVTFVGDATNVTNIEALNAFHVVDRTKFTHWGNNISLVDPNADTYVGMGDRVLGEHERGILVVRWKSLPANYLLSFNLDAPAPIGIREDVVPSLQGLFQIMDDDNAGNTLIRRYRRKIGYAPVNRTGFCVTEIGAGSYSAPTGYTVIPG